MMPTVVVGAGISGLTAALALQQAGREVMVLERTGEVGGLARSLDLDGFLFDIGPHYFFLKTDPRADRMVMDCLGKSAEIFDFQVSVLFRGRNLAWPPSMKSLFRFPPSSLFTTVVNGLRRRFPQDRDCRGFITQFYGQAIFGEFVGPYLEKKIPCLGPAELHREWWLQVGRNIHNQYPSKAGDQVKRIEARSSVPLSVRAKVFFKLVRGFAKTALGKNLRKVLYPKGGMGALPLALARRFEEAGGKLVLDAGDVKLSFSGERIDAVQAGGEKISDPECVIWTGSIYELLSQLDIASPNLPFVPILLGFAKIKRTLDLPPYLYTYYSQPDLVFNRAYFPRLITEGLVPAGKDAVCLEVSPHGEHDEAYYREAMLDGLEKSGLCRREDVESLEIMEVPDAYPVYPLDYYETLQALWKKMGRVDNLWSIGRSAQFYYNNVARSMGVSLDLAEHLLRPATPGEADR